jgi:hypothetical protein
MGLCGYIDLFKPCLMVLSQAQGILRAERSRAKSFAVSVDILLDCPEKLVTVFYAFDRMPLTLDQN